MSGCMRAFLFDIDGTLVDSSVTIERVWRQVAREFGVDETEILRNCHGRRDIDVAAGFFTPETETPSGAGQRSGHGIRERCGGGPWGAATPGSPRSPPVGGGHLRSSAP